MKENNQKNISGTAKNEEEVLAFWKENKIFEKSLNKPAPKGEFVFYDGPPFATGLPHHGHLLGSTSKDLFGRYRTMRGYHVRRRWGWDCHGLPIESKVEEKLGFKSKKDILTLGVEKFNETARSMVLEYVRDWKRYIERLGRWVDFDNSYKTMDSSFTESVWWALKEIYNKGNLYEGRKVLMYCPHCETPLAKAEIAMDNTYKNITEESVVVKFRILDPESMSIQGPAFILAWTTTPWTLPGNVALAVGPEIDYALIKQDDAILIVAKDRADQLGLSSAGANFIKGKALMGLRYEPLYIIEKVKNYEGKKWQVLSGDFVTTTDGTGVVHTAVMYGEDDYVLGIKEGLPIVPLLNANATYNDNAPELVRGYYIKKAEKIIKEDLESRGLLFKKEAYKHSYPHCHRCGTPLIYNAVSSWFINVQSIKDKMLAENESISWVPEHLKHGRFRNIVEGAPDWTISRNRFWASPLPIWKDKEGNITVIGSLAELKSLTKKSGNSYFLMRHGEAEHNLQNKISCRPDSLDKLTQRGEEQANSTARELDSKKIDLIIVSPFMHTVQTADLLAKILGINKTQIITDQRLGEANLGVYEGKTYSDYERDYPFTVENLFKVPTEGESFMEIKRRVGSLLYELEQKYQDKKILVISHEYPLALMLAASSGADPTKTVELFSENRFKIGELRELPFVSIPHNKDYELDYHLPYIDQVELEKNHEPIMRVPEVVDSWVEAGAMPFAEYHYPFENKAAFEKRTPGDFISEYIAQTRTWFYYLHVLGVMLFDHRAFTNVVTTGTILAADGAKMSKSKNNFTDPLISINQYGADTLRYYLMSSVVMQGEDISFKDEDLRDIHNNIVNILRNTKTFYELYKADSLQASNDSPNILDRWILIRLDEVMREATEAFDSFDTVRATRPMRGFIEDLSKWYVRRSRDRIKGDDEIDKKRALATMRYVLREFAKVIAPVMPFIADEIYRGVREESEVISVHLADWNVREDGLKSVDLELIKDMEEVRSVVSLALEARQKANIKVRQPLNELRVDSSRLSGKQDLLILIADEINVKIITISQSIENRVWLDLELTQELTEEGELRALVREVQDLRKTSGLNPKDKAILTVTEDRRAFVNKHWDPLAKATGLESVESGSILGVRKAH